MVFTGYSDTVRELLGSATPRRKDSPFQRLDMFNTIILVDDNDNMCWHWGDVRQAIKMIALTCTKYGENGITLCFVNHRNSDPNSKHDGYNNIKTEHEALYYFEQRQKPQGTTAISQRLEDILVPYNLDMQSMQFCKKEYGQIERPVKPINIIVITNGLFPDGEKVKSIITETAKTLDKCKAPANQAGIQFLQIGNIEKAKDFLKTLDNKLPGRDIVDTTPFSHDLDILKTVLGGVNKKLDNQKPQRRFFN